jgi:hypothetical protein
LKKLALCAAEVTWIDMPTPGQAMPSLPPAQGGNGERFGGHIQGPSKATLGWRGTELSSSRVLR